MTNSQNVRVISDKLLKFLIETDDKHFKRDLVRKISILAERFAPDQKWFIETMNLILEHGSEYMGM
jgi:AP-4 complex subunit epsilon-1